ncbi:MAG: OmpA family protein [Flavobacteriales bacterium]|nr:OmpA family protein [Flavobacteriales bacterium]
MITRILYPALVLVLVLPSCVAKKKYVSATDHVSRLQADSTRQVARIAQLEGGLKSTQSDLAAIQGKSKVLEGELELLQKSLTNSEAMLSKKDAELLDKVRRMDELNRKLDAQTNALNSLRRKVADALVNFKSDELTVTMKDGKVYVSLSEKLLFKSGSADVDPKGKEAIGQLAQVLNANADIGVMVEGHTDTIPIASGRFKDNWELSTARATSIVRILTTDHKLDPKRVTSAGRGEWIPVASNREADGRARNRRTEIILTPDLKELFQLVGEP